MIHVHHIKLYFRIMKRFIKSAMNQRVTMPLSLTVLITSKCSQYNYCKQCWRPPGTRNDIDISIEKIQEIAKYKIPIVLLSGGEPTLHPEFVNIVRIFENSKTSLFILTNGTNLELIKSAVTSKLTRIVLSINQYDNEDKILEVQQNMDALSKENYITYLNIPIDDKFDVNTFFTDNVIRVLKLAKRVYLTLYTLDHCVINNSCLYKIKKAYQIMTKELGIDNVLYTRNYSKLEYWFCEFFAWILGEKFIACSAYPFRATMDENGNIFSCIKLLEDVNK